MSKFKFISASIVVGWPVQLQRNARCSPQFHPSFLGEESLTRVLGIRKVIYPFSSE